MGPLRAFLQGSDRGALINFGLHNVGVVFVVAVPALDHGHQPGGHQAAHLPALVDGAGDPLCLPVRPGIVSTAIYVFINAWNEFLYALLLVSSSTKTTLSVAVKTLEGADILNWGSMMAASAIVVLPSIIFFCLIQNKIAGGLADGAVK